MTARRKQNNKNAPERKNLYPFTQPIIKVQYACSAKALSVKIKLVFSKFHQRLNT